MTDHSFTAPTNLVSHHDALDMFTRVIAKDYVKAYQTPEQIFRDLDVQAGDRVRLTQLVRPGSPYRNSRDIKKDGAILEGVVTRVKVKSGRSRIQIDGFDTAGNGIFWPVENYQIEVLHRVYRWTEEDRLLAAVLGYSEHAWEIITEDSRASLRLVGGERVAKVKTALGLDKKDGGVE